MKRNVSASIHLDEVRFLFKRGPEIAKAIISQRAIKAVYLTGLGLVPVYLRSWSPVLEPDDQKLTRRDNECWRPGHGDFRIMG